MSNVLITARYFAVDPEPLELLRRNGCVITHPDIDWTLGDANMSQARAIELLHDADGAIISSMPITEGVLAQTPRLKVIALRGVGYDSVDVAAATARGIPVAVAPGFTDSVADYVFGLLLAVTRQVARADRLVRERRWEVLVSTNIAGKTLGIIGLGRIGKAVARRARGFDMPVLAADVVRDESFAAAHGVRYVTLEELLGQADVVSINAPLQASHRRVGVGVNEADGVSGQHGARRPGRRSRVGGGAAGRAPCRRRPRRVSRRTPAGQPAARPRQRCSVPSPCRLQP